MAPHDLQALRRRRLNDRFATRFTPCPLKRSSSGDHGRLTKVGFTLRLVVDVLILQTGGGSGCSGLFGLGFYSRRSQGLQYKEPLEQKRHGAILNPLSIVPLDPDELQPWTRLDSHSPIGDHGSGSAPFLTTRAGADMLCPSVVFCFW